MIFSELLKIEMDRAGVNQKALAESSGLTQATISRYLANLREPKWKDVQKLAAALGVGCSAFLEGVETPSPAPAESGSLSHPKGKGSKGKKGSKTT